MNKRKELLGNIDWKQVKVSTFKYLTIIGLSFFLPLFILFIVNEVAVLVKLGYWVKEDIDFWNSNKKLYLTIAIAIFPVVHFFRCYFLTIRNIWLQLHKDYFEHWFSQLANKLVDSLFDKYNKKKESGGEIENDDILIYINEMVSKLPKFLAWVARKLLDQIPYLEIVNSFDTKDLEELSDDKDLEEEKRDSIAKAISEKLNEFAEDTIDGIMPSWTVIIIPINILLVIYYIFI